MLTLSLLLSAAAVVNAIGGGKVSAVEVNKTTVFCADNCIFGGVYFAQLGYYCPEKEVVTRLDDRDNQHPANQDPNFPYDCSGMETKNRFKSRPRSSGEEPTECILVDLVNDPEARECLASKSIGGGTLVVKWADVKKELEGDDATPPKSLIECQNEARENLAKCHESEKWETCKVEAHKALASCAGLE